MKVNIFSKRVAVIFVVLFGAVGVYLLWKTLAAPVSTPLKPSADALVYQSEPSRTYGTEKVIRTDGSPIMRSYLRFKVDAAVPIKKATLRIFAETANSNGYKVATTGNSWAENTITYSNAPAVGAAAGSSGGFKAGTWTSVDVTNIVKANGEYSFALSGADSTQTRYSSRESANPPQLVIETDSAGTPTPPPTPTPTPTPTPAPTPTPGTTQRAAFYYPWFPETWTVNNAHVAYHPLLGYYDSSTQNVADSHIKAMDYAGINVAIASWWGSGTHNEAVRFPQLLSRTTALSSPLKWAIYYEKEGTNDPSVAELQADLSYIKTKYAGSPAFSKVNGKPVVFVYNASANDNSCAVVDRWMQANVGYDFYLVLKVFPGYKSCSKQPDSWHQYSPAVADDSQPGYSYSISPGFKRADEANARLVRDPVRWVQSIKNMVASKAPWQLVATFNEWGEGTAVEAAQEWSSASGYGTYLDALHDATGGTPAPTPDTTKPTAPTGFSANATSTTQVATKWTAATDNVGVTKYNIIRNGTVIGSVSGTTTSFTDTNALPSTTYTYGAVAVDGAGNESPISNTVSVTTPALPTPDTTPPSAPPSLTGTAVSPTQINLSWGASTDNIGVSAYIIYRGGTQIARVTSRTYGDSTLSAGTAYSYTVKAADAANNLSAASNTVSVTTLSPAPPPPPTSGSVCGTKATAPAKYSHVLVIVMENKHYADVIGSSSAPYESGLAKQCATATAYAQAGSPSRPNYIAMVSGSVQGCNGSNSDPPSCQTTADNIMRQARVAGGTSKVYAESMKSNCQYASGSGYATKHNPFPYFIGADDQAACARDNVPLGSNTAGNFINDLNADQLPNWAMIAPNLCNDTHDCSVTTGDNWLKVLLQDHVFKSAAYARGDMAVIIVQDEYTNLPNVWISPSAKAGSVYAGAMTHAGLLKTMEEMLGYPIIPAAAAAHSVRNDFNL